MPTFSSSILWRMRSRKAFKSIFQLSTLDLQLTTNALKQNIYGPISIQYIDSGSTQTLSGLPNTFSNATHKVEPPDPLNTPLIDSWTMQRSNTFQVTLRTSLRTTAGPDQSPVVTIDDAQIDWTAKYANAVQVLEPDGTVNTVTEETVMLVPRTSTNSQSIQVTRIVPAERGAAISSTFFWPPPPQGPSAGYTAPLLAWGETRIEGLTTDPIILRGDYSQSYRPHHHNFAEDFLFEPALEPGIAPSILAELEEKNIRYIYVFWTPPGEDHFPARIYVAGTDGNFRPLLAKPAR